MKIETDLVMPEGHKPKCECIPCETYRRRKRRVQGALRTLGIKWGTKEGEQEPERACGGCSAPLYVGNTDTDGGPVAVWVWLHSAAQNAFGVETARPPPKCPRCRKAKAA